MKTNLEYIRDNGVEKWIKDQKRIWSCSICGAKIYWYQKNLPLREATECMGTALMNQLVLNRNRIFQTVNRL